MNKVLLMSFNIAASLMCLANGTTKRQIGVKLIFDKSFDVLVQTKKCCFAQVYSCDVEHMMQCLQTNQNIHKAYPSILRSLQRLIQRSLL